jgi:hypothetical protein
MMLGGSRLPSAAMGSRLKMPPLLAVTARYWPVWVTTAWRGVVAASERGWVFRRARDPLAGLMA